nr:hypothetical protein [Tanacetum cinerariifolium]
MNSLPQAWTGCLLKGWMIVSAPDSTQIEQSDFTNPLLTLVQPLPGLVCAQTVLSFPCHSTATGGKRLSEEEDCGQVA